MARDIGLDDVLIDVRAPAKPAFGAGCNGCGLCCASEPCPVGMVIFRRRSGACPALTWDEASRRYVCAVVRDPASVLPWLPVRWAERLRPLFVRWIAAGKGCDSSAVFED